MQGGGDQLPVERQVSLEGRAEAASVGCSWLGGSSGEWGAKSREVENPSATVAPDGGLL